MRVPVLFWLVLVGTGHLACAQDPQPTPNGHNGLPPRPPRPSHQIPHRPNPPIHRPVPPAHPNPTQGPTPTPVPRTAAPNPLSPFPLPPASEESTEAPPETQKNIVIEPVVPQTRRMSNKVAIVADASGSMNDVARISIALGFIRYMIGHGDDHLDIAAFAFSDEFVRWPGVPYTGNGRAPPRGWTAFPSEEALDNVNSWLRAQVASGGTNPVGAMLAALREDVDDLTVMLIMDGEFDSVDAFNHAVEDGQLGRVARGRQRAIIIVVGVGPNVRKQDHLEDVGRSEGGGFYVVREEEPATDQRR